MKNTLVLLVVILLAKCLYAQESAQVYINSDQHPTAVLAMNHSEKGFLLPKVVLRNVTQASPLKTVVDGMMVYNTFTNVAGGQGTGIYMWIKNRWVRSGENSNVYIINDNKQTVYLGYTQNFNDLGKGEFTFNSGMYGSTKAFLKGNCVVNSVNGHTYCFYETNSSGLNWEDAFRAAEGIGGYLATITTAQEQQFIEEQLSSKNISKNIWLGMRKTKYSGLDNMDNSKLTPKVYPITGETFEVVWSNKPTIFHNFYTSEINESEVNQGCILMLGDRLSDSSINRFKWKTIDCGKTNYLGSSDLPSSGVMSYFIVEYDKQ